MGEMGQSPSIPPSGGTLEAWREAMLYILSARVLPNYGEYRFQPISIKAAQSLVTETQFVSAVGHEAAASALSLLLEVEMPVNRVSIQMEPGDRAILLSMKGRLPEGKVATLQELEAIGFELGLLERTG